MKYFRPLFLAFCSLIIAFILSKNTFAVTWSLAKPSGSIDISLDGYASNASYWNSERKDQVVTFSTPTEGRPWTVISEKALETTRNCVEKTGYSLKFLPSRDNVEKVVLEVWADKREGLNVLGFKPASTWIGMQIRLSLSPLGRNLGNSFHTEMNDEKLRRMTTQSQELSDLLESFQPKELEKNQEMLAKIDQTLMNYEDGKILQQNAELLINKYTSEYTTHLDHFTWAVIKMKNKWEVEADSTKAMLTDLNIPLLDPSVKALIELNLTLIEKKKTDFTNDIESFLNYLSGTNFVKTPKITVPSLFGSFRYMNPETFEFGDVIRFYNDAYCKEPSFEAALQFGNPIEPIFDRNQLSSMMENRKDDGTCK
jgi:hypothetical protein